jgi:HEAT repeat protein
VIRDSLFSTNLEVRIAAFKAAIILHIPLSYDELKKGLADDEWPVRAQAATASGKLGDRAVIDELGKALCDPSWWVRNNAGQALYRLGPAGIDELERIIRESDDRFARDMAARTLTSDPVYNALFRSKKLLDTGKDEASDSSKKGTN